MIVNSVANHLWQSTLFAGAVWLLTRTLRQNRAAVRYGLWLAASAKFMIPLAALTAIGSQFAWRTAPVPPPALAMVTGAMEPFPPAPLPLGSLQGATPAVVDPRDALAVIVGGIWAIGVVAIFLRWMWQWWRVASSLRSQRLVEDRRVLGALRAIEDSFGTRRRVSLVSSDSPVEPGIFGIFRPVLLWPRRISDHLNDAQIDAILAHEVGHVRRYDNLSAAAHKIVESVFWFHPLVWWIGGRLIEERERACDELVVALGGEPQVYAESILRTCQFFVASPVAAGVTSSNLRRRIEEIMTGRRTMALTRWRKTVLATAAAVVVAGPVLVGAIAAPRLRAQSPRDDTSAALKKEIDSRIEELERMRTAAERYRRGQSAAVAPRPAFDVTSVKPNNSGSGQITMLPAANGGWQASNITLGMLVRMSFQLQDSQIVGGPKWLFQDRFDVMGTGTSPGRDGALFEKVKSLLVDRFRLVTHMEKREEPMFVLVLARPDGRLGEKLTPSTADCTPAAGGARGRGQPAMPAPGERPRCGFRIGPGQLAVGGQTMAAFAQNLSRFVGGIVVDRTSLNGTYDIELSYTPDPGINPFGRDLPPQPGPPPAVNSDAPSIFVALQEQLGLKLEATKGPVDVLVVDSAEKPTQD